MNTNIQKITTQYNFSLSSLFLDLLCKLSLGLRVVEGSLSPNIVGGGDTGEVLVDSLGSLGHVLEVPALIPLVDLARSHDLVVWVVKELVPMSEPSSKSWKGEEDCEHLCWDAQSLVDNTRVEVYVWIELSLDEVLVCESDSLKLHSDVDEWLFSDNGEYLLGNCPDDLGSWVVVFINPMSESHEHLLPVLDIFDKLWDLVDATNLFEHPQDSLVGSSVSWTIEGSDSSSKRGVDITL